MRTTFFFVPSGGQFLDCLSGDDYVKMGEHTARRCSWWGEAFEGEVAVFAMDDEVELPDEV